MEKKMILVLDTDEYSSVPIGAASDIGTARIFAINWLDKQYDAGEWEIILEEDGYKSKDDLFHDMMLGLESEWERFNISFTEVSFVG